MTSGRGIAALGTVVTNAILPRGGDARLTYNGRMLKIRVLLPLLLLAGLGASEGTEGEEVSVKLKTGLPTATARLGYSMARPLIVEATVPRFIIEIPKFHAKDPLFFRVALGETKGVPFYAALDRSPAGTHHDLLYLDRNRDLDLTNDGDPIKGRIRVMFTTQRKLVEFLNLKLDLPYMIGGKDVTTSYTSVFYYVVQGKTTPKTIQVERDGWREGRVRIAGSDYVVVLVDDDSDGQYTESDSWALKPASADLGTLLRGDLMRTMLRPSWSTDQKWTVEVKSVVPDGTAITFSVQKAVESEDDFFLRLYRARQSPQERKLKIDPRRPKARQNQKIDWLVGKNAQYAIDIGAKVKKRILLDFTSRTCPHCANMNAFTYRDREVVQLCKRLVCAKINFLPSLGDTLKYGAEGTPTFVILDTNGTEVDRTMGFTRPTDFAAWLKKALR